MDNKVISIVALLSIAVFSGTAQAHRPSFGLSYDSAERAFQVEDPDISMVLYQPVTCESDQLWLTFEAERGYELYLQLGVPVLERLSDYRPAIALLAPGLPEPPAGLPFEVPEGLGARVYETDQLAEPDSYYEEFTQTSSWILVEDTVTLPESGRGYLVGWDPSGWTGKIWIAVGTLEDFSGVGIDEFMEWDHLVKDFHEVSDHDHKTGELVERQCNLDEGSVGCSTTEAGGSALMLAGFAGLALFARRKRRSVSASL